MFKYKLGDEVGALEDWPFDNPLSNYVIRSGTPKTSGRIDTGGPGHTTRYGIWRCTKGAFECTEQGDELMMIPSGECRLTNHVTGEVSDLKQGDSLFIRDGSQVTWDVRYEVTKVFFGHKADGY